MDYFTVINGVLNFIKRRKMNRKIKNWCAYCKCEIYEGDPFTIFEGETYHPDCFRQLTTYTGYLEGEDE